MILQELLALLEAKNEYSSFKSWKAAIKKKHPEAWIDGDEDIAQAMVGPKPFKRGETKSVGEWDGSKGELFEGEDKTKMMIMRDYRPVLTAHGFKLQPGGKWYKTSGCGEITITKHGHWEHLGVGESDNDTDYEGTTAHTLDRHLTSLGM